MFANRSFRMALPIPWLATLAVALVVLWGLVSLYGPTRWVLIGWLIGWLITSRAVNWIIARRRKALKPEPVETEE